MLTEWLTARGFADRPQHCRGDELDLSWRTFLAPGKTHDHTPRSRHRPDHSAPAVAQSRHDDAPECGDALRALAAARADIPPPPVRSTEEMEVMGRMGLPVRKGAPANLDETAAHFFSALDCRGSPAAPEGRKK